MPRQRFEKLDPAKQAEILGAAFEEFSEKGYEGASLGRIIEKAGLSRGMLYYYFEDKADLFVTVVKQAVEVFSGAITIPSAGSPAEFWRQLEKSVENLSVTALRDPRAVAIMKLTASISNQGVPRAASRELRSLWLEKMEKIGRVGLEAGAIRKDLPFALLMSAAMGMHQGIDLWVLENWEKITEEERLAFPAKAFALMRRVLGQEPG